MSPERAKETNGHHRPIVLFRPFRAREYDSRIPRAALRLPWADMFLALQADDGAGVISVSQTIAPFFSVP